MSIRVRIAPSPTGSPHVGTLRTAIFNWLLARHEGGQFIVRLEDTDRDPVRYKPEAIGEIEQALSFLGVEPDEWWVSGGPAGPYVQSERLELYREAADRLIAGGHAYRCYCTEERLAEMRAKQESEGGATGYDRRCRNLSAEERARHEAGGLPYTVRLAVPLEGETAYTDLVYGEITFQNRLVDDQVLLKSNGWPTYHLAVVVDDHAMGITHVLRGEEWMSSTPKQVLLYEALGWDMPAWAHLPLLVGPDRKKLGKRHGSTQFLTFVAEGYLPEALFNFLVLLGWSAGDENRELFTREELIPRFTIAGIQNHPAVFDHDKLRWMNGEYIRSCEPDRLVDLCIPYLARAGLVADPPGEEERRCVARVIPLVCERIKVLSEVVDATEFLFRSPDTPEDKGRRKWLTGERPLRILDSVLAALPSLPESPSEAELEAMTNGAAEELGLDRGTVIHTLRMAATGRTVGPGLFETLAVLGRDRLRERFERAKTWVTA